MGLLRKALWDLFDCDVLPARDYSHFCEHVYRELNSDADKLAGLAHVGGDKLEIDNFLKRKSLDCRPRIFLASFDGSFSENLCAAGYTIQGTWNLDQDVASAPFLETRRWRVRFPYILRTWQGEEIGVLKSKPSAMASEFVACFETVLAITKWCKGPTCEETLQQRTLQQNWWKTDPCA